MVKEFNCFIEIYRFDTCFRHYITVPHGYCDGSILSNFERACSRLVQHLLLREAHTPQLEQRAVVMQLTIF